MTNGGGALEGIRVLDVTQVMAGPFCAMQLCDMGAEVIKVEPPDGDSTRSMAGASGTDSPAFNAVNRGKRGIVLDLKSSAGQQAFRRLLARTDIVIENYRPGVMRKFGLDYATLAGQHPALIYASISGYGQTGPDRDKGGFDLIAQGVSGLMSVTGEPGGPPVKVGVPLTDLGAALFALSAVLAALHYRGRTGQGQYIDTSLVEAGIALSVWESVQYFAEGTPPQPMGSAHRLMAPYQAIRCADGYITLCGRMGDVIISGGFNIYPREIEDALLGHPGVREAAVVGAPDALRGEVPVAYLVADETVEDEAVRERLKRELASFKLPRAFVRMDSLPRTALGKVQRHLLPPLRP